MSAAPQQHRTPGNEFSPEDIQLMLDNLDKYTPDEQHELYRIVSELEAKKRAEAAKDDLIEFCRLLQPDYKVGEHHRILGGLLMEIERGREYNADGDPLHGTGKDRISVNMPPRHGKSQLVSIYFPAWFLGRNPDKKVLMVSHTTDLAVDFGRKVRNIINSDTYKEVFPHVALASDSKSAGRWNTNLGGVYFACGVGSALAGRGADLLLVDDPRSVAEGDSVLAGFGVMDGSLVVKVTSAFGDRQCDRVERLLERAMAGRGAHLLLVDDPHNEQDIINGNLSAFDKAYEWFTYGARTRLMPQGRIAIIQTRWSEVDLTGRLTTDMVKNHLADQYEVVEFPALLDIEQDDPEGTDKKVTVEKPLWPEFFSLEALHRTKASMPLFQWNAQYQQNPTAEEGSIIKREWWQPWYPEHPPQCEYIIMTLDAAAEANNRADFSAVTVWGVFHYEGDQFAREMTKSGDSRDEGGFTYTKEVLGVPDTYNIILLNSAKRRLEFPELKDFTWEMYNEWQPDAFIVEKKSSGAPLYQELRRTGMLIQEYTPTRGTANNPNNKMARLNSVADIVRSKLVWAPQARWAEEVIEEVAGFPYASHDDLVDTMIMALMRFRQGGFITLPSDEPEEERYFKQRRGGYY